VRLGSEPLLRHTAKVWPELQPSDRQACLAALAPRIAADLEELLEPLIATVWAALSALADTRAKRVCHG
jgi:hypothetical protein